MTRRALALHVVPGITVLVRRIAAAGVMVAALASPAAADLVHFTSGRTMSVAGHRLEGDRMILELRGGGEIVCEAALIARIEPDEIPYPVLASSPSADAALAPTPLLAGRPYSDLIDTIAAAEGIDARLIHAVVQVESGYQPRARSPKGAMGLMQLMPGTARDYGVRNAYDPRSNLEAGVRHLKGLLRHFDLSDALAAYNAGEAAVRRFGGIPPYRETQEYVARILRLLGAQRP